jgi:hypothetical protein
MEAATISAVAALAGATIGGLTSFVTSWRTQQTQVRAQQLAHKLTRREDLYKSFVEEAARLYADSLLRETPDISQLIKLYSMISLMRVVSPVPVVEAAEKVTRMIVNTYLAPKRHSQNYETW